jgi:tetratricopeptide (TPR) repeat protein
LNEEADELLASLKEKFPEHQNWTIPEDKSAALAEMPVEEDSMELILEDTSSVVAEPVVTSDGDKKAVDLEALGAKVKLEVQADSRDEGEEDFFDLAGELESELEEEEPALAPEVSGVLDAFKQGVSQSVSADDFQTHYDLGIAYREMSLVAEAIDEFKLCAAIPGKETTSYYQIGLCYSELGQLNEAKESFEKALSQDAVKEDEKISLNYELAEVLLSLDEKTEAKRLFQEVQKMDPEFRETQEKLQQLG